MKLIIAGCRDMDDAGIVHEAILESNFGPQVTEVVSGGAQGVDSCGESLAELSGLPVKVFRADWNKHGKAAGPIRNREMAKYADALVAVWDGQSSGTKNMIDEMKALGKPVFIKLVVKDISEHLGWRTK